MLETNIICSEKECETGSLEMDLKRFEAEAAAAAAQRGLH